MSVVCKKCGLPEDLCACGELEKEESKIVIRLEKRRFNKDTTMIEGIGHAGDLDKIVKYLKSRLACGGLQRTVTYSCKGIIGNRLRSIL